MKRCLFLYTSGRKDRIAEFSKNKLACEFLYGYKYFQEQGVEIDFIEVKDLKPSYFDWKFWKLRNISQQYIKILGIGSYARYFLNYQNFLNQFDVLIATTDSIGLALAYYKNINALAGKIIFIDMGLSAGLYALKTVDIAKYEEIKYEIQGLLSSCHRIISLGCQSHKFLSGEFSSINQFMLFLPFGIDCKFWIRETFSLDNDKGYVLSVGNDRNRNWQLAIEIARSMPDCRFKFVTQKVKQTDCPDNVEVISGEFRQMLISDEEMRSLYCGSRLLMMPLNNTLQPSGQSVALQAMASGTPVLMSNIPGLWDPSNLIDNENIFLMNTDSLDSWRSKIFELLDDESKREHVIENAKTLVTTRYSMAKFSQHLFEACK